MSALNISASNLMLETPGMAVRKIKLPGLQIEKKKIKRITVLLSGRASAWAPKGCGFDTQ